jgi:hypothetical protein
VAFARSGGGVRSRKNGSVKLSFNVKKRVSPIIPGLTPRDHVENVLTLLEDSHMLLSQARAGGMDPFTHGSVKSALFKSSTKITGMLRLHIIAAELWDNRGEARLAQNRYEMAVREVLASVELRSLNQIHSILLEEISRQNGTVRIVETDSGTTPLSRIRAGIRKKARGPPSAHKGNGKRHAADKISRPRLRLPRAQ